MLDLGVFMAVSAARCEDVPGGQTVFERRVLATKARNLLQISRVPVTLGAYGELCDKTMVIESADLLLPQQRSARYMLQQAIAREALVSLLSCFLRNNEPVPAASWSGHWSRTLIRAWLQWKLMFSRGGKGEAGEVLMQAGKQPDSLEDF